jgi:cellulose biosynthesis protein BcsQ
MVIGMSAKTIAVANMKGGVGKTATVVALGETLASIGARGAPKRVLVIDLDAQANASFCLCGDAALADLIEGGQTIDAYLEDRVVFGKTRQLGEFVHPDASPLRVNGSAVPISLIASSPELRLVEREIIYFLSGRRRSLMEIERHVRDLLAPELDALKSRFDFILFDCAPGISALTEVALRASDLVVVPTIPDFISNLGLEAFCKAVLWANHNEPERQRLPWVVANRVRYTPHQTTMLAEMRAEAEADDAGFRMFRTEIPDRPVMEEAVARTENPTESYAAKYGEEMSAVLARLVDEMMGALDGR